MRLHLKGQRELGVLPRLRWLLRFFPGLRGLVGQLPVGFVELGIHCVELRLRFQESEPVLLLQGIWIPGERGVQNIILFFIVITK